MEWRHLFTPLRIGAVTVKNRLGFSPNCPVTGGDLVAGLFNEDSVHYYGERAKGGQGLIIIGNTRVSRRTPYYPFLDPQLYDERNIRPLRRIAKKVHEHGTRIFIQLFYASLDRTMEPQQSSLYGDSDIDLTVPGPSALSALVPGIVQREIPTDEVAQIVEE